MHTAWVKGAKDKEARLKEVLSYRNAFDELREILLRDFKKKESVRDYSNPNWAYQQIANNEYNAVLETVLKLIDIKE